MEYYTAMNTQNIVTCINMDGNLKNIRRKMSQNNTTGLFLHPSSKTDKSKHFIRNIHIYDRTTSKNMGIISKKKIQKNIYTVV